MMPFRGSPGSQICNLLGPVHTIRMSICGLRSRLSIRKVLRWAVSFLETKPQHQEQKLTLKRPSTDGNGRSMLTKSQGTNKKSERQNGFGERWVNWTTKKWKRGHLKRQGRRKVWATTTRQPKARSNLKLLKTLWGRRAIMRSRETKT